MIDRLIEFSLKEQIHRRHALDRHRCVGIVGDAARPHRRDSRSSENQVIVFTDWQGEARKRSRTKSLTRCRETCRDLQGYGLSARQSVQLLDDLRHLQRQHRFLFARHPVPSG